MSSFEFWKYYNPRTGRYYYVKEWANGRQVKISKRRYKRGLQNTY